MQPWPKCIAVPSYLYGRYGCAFLELGFQGGADEPAGLARSEAISNVVDATAVLIAESYLLELLVNTRLGLGFDRLLHLRRAAWAAVEIFCSRGSETD